MKAAQILEALEFLVRKDQERITQKIPALDLGDGLQTLKRLQNRVLLQHKSTLETSAFPQGLDLFEHVVLGCFETVACCVFADAVCSIKTIQKLKRWVPAHQYGTRNVSTHAGHTFSRSEYFVTIDSNRHPFIISTDGSEAGKSINIRQCLIVRDLYRPCNRRHRSEALDL
jgi:hypothetical protein